MATKEVKKTKKSSLERMRHNNARRIRKNKAKRLHNRYYAKTTRNAVRLLRATAEEGEAKTLLPKVSSLLDKLAKRNIIHKNKASNLKSKLAKHVNSLATA
ncbi:MAG: 30S ribosomal protein S20 [Tannerellaceae bacterium]|jgi:small subunit ribosomal protein S20|nr:30S ribosomal protein S20 [Tannerellaceae bacterium]